MIRQLRLLAVVTLMCTCSLSAPAQTITLDEIQQKASSHYPAIARYEIIEKSKQFDLANASRPTCRRAP